ncbi:hypothetical protein TWF696_008325 [Orbilia brochopaga]|uniref:Uncharacterized protein n=1 Tax=Orbilia brochopaga TaxID=3140254 RepID=A0AAV9UIS5_9PEZI
MAAQSTVSIVLDKVDENDNLGDEANEPASRLLLRASETTESTETLRLVPQPCTSETAKDYLARCGNVAVIQATEHTRDDLLSIPSMRQEIDSLKATDQAHQSQLKRFEVKQIDQSQ